MKRSERGQMAALVAVLVPALLALGALVWDLGGALATKRALVDQAYAAARAGAEELSPDAQRAGATRPDAPRAAAAGRAALASAGLDGRVAVEGDVVVVTVTATRPSVLAAVVGRDAIRISARGQARALAGVTEPEETE